MGFKGSGFRVVLELPVFQISCSLHSRLNSLQYALRYKIETIFGQRGVVL